VTDNRAIAGVWLMFAADSFVATLCVPYELSRERSDSGQLDPAGPLKRSAREIQP
jgi:hypothetical protein